MPATEPTNDFGSESRLSRLEQLLERIATSIESDAGDVLAPRDVAAVLKICTSQVHQLNSRGLLPAPSMLSDRAPRWSRRELVAWIEAGSPPRGKWAAMRISILASARRAS